MRKCLPECLTYSDLDWLCHRSAAHLSPWAPWGFPSHSSPFVRTPVFWTPLFKISWQCRRDKNWDFCSESKLYSNVQLISQVWLGSSFKVGNIFFRILKALLFWSGNVENVMLFLFFVPWINPVFCNYAVSPVSLNLMIVHLSIVLNFGEPFQSGNCTFVLGKFLELIFWFLFFTFSVVFS